MSISREIGRYKKEHSMPVVQAGRYNDVLRSRIQAGEELGMSAEFMRNLPPCCPRRVRAAAGRS